MIGGPDHASSSGTYADYLEHLSDEEFWKLAAQEAEMAPAAPAQGDNYLLCGLRLGPCVLSLAHLREVVSPPYQFTRLPASPQWMLGITAWRGEILAVIDLEAFLLDKRALPLADRVDGILLITGNQDSTLGLLVSSAASTCAMDSAALAPAEPAATRYAPLRAKAIKGIYREQQGYNEPVEALALDIPTIFCEVTRHMRMAMPYE